MWLYKFFWLFLLFNLFELLNSDLFICKKKKTISIQLLNLLIYLLLPANLGCFEMLKINYNYFLLCLQFHENLIIESMYFPDFFAELRPELIAPVVAWLCHESCEDNGSIIESAVGWAGKCKLGNKIHILNLLVVEWT